MSWSHSPSVSQLEQAQEIVNVGLRHCPGNQQLMHTRAMLLLHLKKREEARAILQDLLKSDHLNAHALHTLGLMAQVDAEPQTALKFFKEGALYGLLLCIYFSTPCLQIMDARGSNSFKLGSDNDHMHS